MAERGIAAAGSNEFDFEPALHLASRVPEAYSRDIVSYYLLSMMHQASQCGGARSCVIDQKPTALCINLCLYNRPHPNRGCDP